MNIGQRGGKRGKDSKKGMNKKIRGRTERKRASKERTWGKEWHTDGYAFCIYFTQCVLPDINT